MKFEQADHSFNMVFALGRTSRQEHTWGSGPSATRAALWSHYSCSSATSRPSAVSSTHSTGPSSALPEMTRNITQNDPKHDPKECKIWPKMTWYDPKHDLEWLIVTQYDPKWPDMTRNMIWNYPKQSETWPGMTQIDLIWRETCTEMTRNMIWNNLIWPESSRNNLIWPKIDRLSRKYHRLQR